MAARKPKEWGKNAVKRPGALTRKARRAHETPMEYARQHYHDSGLTGEQARYAVNRQKRVVHPTSRARKRT